MGGSVEKGTSLQSTKASGGAAHIEEEKGRKTEVLCTIAGMGRRGEGRRGRQPSEVGKR